MSPAEFIEIFFPIYSILGVGYVFARLGYVTIENMAGANTFLFWVSIPALVFRSLSTGSLPAPEAGLLLVGYFFVAISVFVAWFAFSRHRLLIENDPTVFAMGANYSNTILVGLPIISHVAGANGVLALFWIVTFHAIILFTIAAMSLEADRKIKSLAELGRLLQGSLRRNPLALAAAAGVAFNASGFEMPEFAAKPLDMAGAVTVPLGLFLVGVNLGTYRASSHHF
ncbi:AEC family transporter [uncultured Cohaesibacter sp.]|uniref:AEC family transporter n=1 Tax=uncultured Cohaesibacter sp. TaxID=1002546 RepID=UPI0029C71652|nr:AEC family transporter [uncultured Cohaesibacter sp.]